MKFSVSVAGNPAKPVSVGVRRKC